VDNFRAALSWSLLEPTELEAGLRLAASLVHFWLIDGMAGEGSEWLGALLARAPGGAARVEALSASGFLLVRLGNPRAAQPLLEEAVALARQLGDGRLLAVSLNHLGELRVQEGDLAGARSALEESLALNSEETDQPVFWPPYFALYNLGEVADLEGDPDAAAALWERCLELARVHQDGFRTVPLRLLGQLALDRGDLVRAHDLLAESVLVARNWGKGAGGETAALALLANLAMAEAQPARALRLAGAAIGLREEHQARLQPTETARLETWIGSARRAVGEAAAATAWAEGHAMTVDQAVAYALEKPSIHPQTFPAAILTSRETEVARLLGRFATNREIAAGLIISERTAKRHVENILLKLGLRSRVQVAEWARAQRL
jgi:DNA-binding CsgD family transcriptional regulator/tetratricopeptide (TPR) repeat protein